VNGDQLYKILVAYLFRRHLHGVVINRLEIGGGLFMTDIDPKNLEKMAGMINRIEHDFLPHEKRRRDIAIAVIVGSCLHRNKNKTYDKIMNEAFWIADLMIGREQND
jgi:hypothetical protein